MGGRRLGRGGVGAMGGMRRGTGLGWGMVAVGTGDMREVPLGTKEDTLVVVVVVMAEDMEEGDMVRLRATTEVDTSEDTEDIEPWMEN